MKVLRLLTLALTLNLILFSLLPASLATVYNGIVKSIKGADMVLMQKGGAESSVQLTKDTRVFASGKIVPYSRIKPNSIVQVSIASDGRCLQVVVEEGPK